MHLAPLVLIVLFHIMLEVCRSAVLVFNSPGYCIRLPPVVILTLLGFFFLRSAVYDYPCIRNDPVLRYVLDTFEVQKTHCVRPLSVLKTLTQSAEFLAHCF